MKTAKVNNWILMRYTPLVYAQPGNELPDYWALPTEKPICLWGQTYDDYRANYETTAFIDGHRIITGDLISFNREQAITARTVYNLLDINPKYAEWLKEQGFDVENANAIIYINKAEINEQLF